MIELRRVYERHGTRGTRFLVERLWPRGIGKESLHFSDWLKDVAPSDSLRRWLQHEVPKWAEFKALERAETTGVSVELRDAVLDRELDQTGQVANAQLLHHPAVRDGTCRGAGFVARLAYFT